MQGICTLRTLLARNLEYHPDKAAFIEGERRWTFRDFTDRTRRMGNALLGLGAEKGERVAILSRNSMENAESYFSIPNAGLVLVMLNFRLAPPELEGVLNDAQASVLMVHEEFLDRIEEIGSRLTFVKHYILIGKKAGLPEGWHHYETLIEESSPHEPAVEIAEDDLAALMYTSGTTGVPKGCMVLHRNFYHAGKSLAFEMKMEREDAAIIPTPLFHAAGLVILMNGVYSGISTVIMPRWDVEEFMRLVEHYKVTTGVLATPMLLFFVEHPHIDRYDLSSLKKILFAGAPVTPVVFKKAIERFGNIFIHGFGTTETVGSICILGTDEIASAMAEGRMGILGSCGKSYTDMQVEVVDENDNPVPPGVIGEIRVRGSGMTQGYWKNKEDTKKAFKNGWFYTEDLCRRDEQGFVYIVGRKKDMIITGAENVFPAEVESVLYKHPAVSQAAVVGMPNEKWGEVVTAFVVKKENSVVTMDDITCFCKKEIAGYKVPKRVYFVDSLPMSPTGKLLKYKLKEQLPL
ncbi:class I adenylate-forming enzyme family protein [Desulforhabdus amnigena]|uniref:Fatty-acyl-CoA synthase n=1 Tax=Desulforhabdus amnigena TaxID=40218 RepID=A0A9W6FUF5_9BACT|nr:long-chain-fatty-acid--CoA ligase [Desulforhabdus amnigena]NLJ27557.1 long-chain-fatty-acid--CoA ligase [Deltaproteobacteria bacterium]GLI35078.1 fatty-acyl-CoA synthase [Desulforhabdus amnigena]